MRGIIPTVIITSAGVLISASVAAVCGVLTALILLQGTDAPEWAVRSLGTIVTFQVYFYFSNIRSREED